MSSNSEQLLLKATLLHPEAVTYVRCGFLWQAHPALGSADWSRRWYSWTDGVLKHCSSPAAAEREVMQPALRGVLVDAQPLSNLELRGMQQLFGFCVQAVTGEAMALYAETEDSRERWLRAINSAGRPMALSDRYNVDFTSPLGSGLCAVVLKATKKHSGEACAVKMIKPETFTSLRHMLNRELFVWSALSFHPHILHLQDVLQSSTRLYFITDLCQGGSLLRHLASRASYSECDAARMVHQVLAALQHMHSCGTVHCDVKPENICMASRTPDAPVKLLDMGMASFVHCPMEPGGTPEFVAPELLQRPEHYAAHGCGPEVDIWSAGVLLYYLLSGRTPFYAATMDGIIARVKTGTWVFKGTCWQDVSEHAKAVVRRMLQVQPSSRPSAAELLKTPWLSGSAPNKPLAAALAAFKAQAGDPQPEPPAPAPVTAPRMPRPASFTQLPADGVAVPQDAAQSMARQRRATYATYDSALDPRLMPMLPQQQQQPGAAMLAGRSSALPAVAEQHQQLPGLGNFVPQQAAALLESLHAPGAGVPRVFQRSQSHSISSPLVSSSLGQQPYPWDNPNPPLLSSHVLEPITAYTSPRNSNHGLFGGPLDALLWARPTSDSADTSNRTSRTSNSGVQLGLTSDNSQSAAQYKGYGRSVSVDEIGIRKQAQSQPQLHHANPQAVSQQQILMLQEQVMALRLAVAAKHQQEQLNTGGSAMSSQLAATSLAPAMPPAAFSVGLLPAGIAADGAAGGGAGVAVGGPLNGIAKGMLHGTLDLSSIPEQAVMPQGRSSPRKSMSLSAVDMAGLAGHRVGTEQQARWSGACVLGTIADEGEETYFDAVEHPTQPAVTGGSAAATQPAPQLDGRSVHALQLQALQQQLLELRAKVQAGKGGTASGLHS